MTQLHLDKVKEVPPPAAHQRLTKAHASSKGGGWVPVVGVQRDDDDDDDHHQNHQSQSSSATFPTIKKKGPASTVVDCPVQLAPSIPKDYHDMVQCLRFSDFDMVEYMEQFKEKIENCNPNDATAITITPTTNLTNEIDVNDDNENVMDEDEEDYDSDDWNMEQEDIQTIALKDLHNVCLPIVEHMIQEKNFMRRALARQPCPRFEYASMRRLPCIKPRINTPIIYTMTCGRKELLRRTTRTTTTTRTKLHWP